MKKQHVSLYLIMSVFVGLLLVPLTSAETSIESVTIEPEEPARLGDITFSAIITGEEIQEVYLLVQECNDDICYAIDSFNESMSPGDANNYSSSITLTKDDATYIKYAFSILTEQGWEVPDSDDYTNVDLTVNSDNGNQNDNNDGSNGNSDSNTPGFELVIVLTILCTLALLIRRYRFQ